VTELERLARDGGEAAEIVRKILEWRQLSKLKSTYTDALQAQINPDRPRPYQLQPDRRADRPPVLDRTQPPEHPDPHRGRAAAARGVHRRGRYVLIAADYSQIELRLAAHMADDARAARGVRQWRRHPQPDRQELFGEVNRDTRGRAKTINFAILYGIALGPCGSPRRVGGRGASHDRPLFRAVPGINRYIAETLSSVREKGFTSTLFGRKTHFPRIASRNQGERRGERAAINAPIQGTSADIIKRAMVRMEPALAAGLGHVRMLLQVHDELVFEAPEADAEAAGAVIREVMAGAAEPAVSLSVPLGVEIGFGKSWGAAH
jgi:DNA polymerase-1